jgi:hypothetical protein
LVFTTGLVTPVVVGLATGLAGAAVFVVVVTPGLVNSGLFVVVVVGLVTGLAGAAVFVVVVVLVVDAGLFYMIIFLIKLFI